jgi:hypothetical protein
MQASGCRGFGWSVGAAETTRPGLRSLSVVYRTLADTVVVVHFGFIAFVAAGGLLAWRWPRVLWLHVPAVAWGLGIVTVGYDCPLTPIEKDLRRLGDQAGYEGGFVDRYVENVIYPESYTSLLRASAAALIIAGWAGSLVKLRHTVDRTTV